MGRMLVALGLLILCACAGTPKPSISLEPVDAKQELLNILAAVPTDFKVEPGDDAHSWERVLFFFKKYTSKHQISQDGDMPWSYQVASVDSPSDSLHFSVRKRFYRGNYLYKVFCQPNAAAANKMSMEMAILNARNLARFIREGKLEVSLLSGAFPGGLFVRRRG